MIVDVNVLLGYVDPDATFHGAATRWLEGELNGTSRVGFPWHSLTGFLRIVTNPRAYLEPLSVDEAMSYVDAWLGAQNAWVPQPGPQHATILRRLLTDAGAAATLVPDAHLAALAVEHGVPVCSFDSDFARFPDVRWHRPR